MRKLICVTTNAAPLFCSEISDSWQHFCISLKSMVAAFVFFCNGTHSLFQIVGSETAGPVGNTRQNTAFDLQQFNHLRSNKVWNKLVNEFLCGWSSKDRKNTWDKSGGVSSSQETLSFRVVGKRKRVRKSELHLYAELSKRTFMLY